MQTAHSVDATPIAYDVIGEGERTVVVVNGAMSTADDARALADALAAHGVRTVVWDRRGRRDSGDVEGGTGPDAPDREVEDLTAVLAAVRTATGGEPAVLGHSSGAVLALYAASLGAPVSRLFLSEPPFSFDDRQPGDLPKRLQALVDAGEPDEAVATFQRDGAGLADAMIDGIRASPLWRRLVPLAQSTVYDALLTARVATPTAAMTGIDVPVVILVGEPTFPKLEAAAERLAAAMPDAELVRNPASQHDAVDAESTARIVAERMPG